MRSLLATVALFFVCSLGSAWADDESPQPKAEPKPTALSQNPIYPDASRTCLLLLADL